ncbi:MAG: hypothetical protein Q8920_17390 [Bacillota bacterium]|nr:hypothetical protein [Bacillota bacterium]
MGASFSTYLIYILLISLFVTTSLLLFLKRRNNKNVEEKAHRMIMAGNVSVFFDETGSVTIIPYVKNNYGIGKAVAQPVMLCYPYKSDKLGEAIRTAMKLCENGIPGTDAELMGKLNFRDWKDFSRNKRNISVHFDDNYGLVMNSTRRLVDGSYQFNFSRMEMNIGRNSTNIEIGEAILSLLPRCR